MPEQGADPLEFYERWAELTRLSERIYQRGFDDGQTLFVARHEIRSLASHPLDASGYRHLVVAGDKLGCWYASELDIEHPERPRWCELPGVPAADGADRVVDDIQIVSHHQGFGVVLATRGHGAWLVDLEQVRRRLLEEDVRRLELIRLPGSHGRSIRRLTYDPASETLLAIAQHEFYNELFQWSLGGDEPRLAWREELPYRITALAIDRADAHEGSGIGDQLFVATGRFELHSFERESPSQPFRVTAEGLEERTRHQQQVWSGRLSPILQMRPLSDVNYRDPETGRFRRTYPHRGVLATTLRHLLVIYDTPEEPGRARCHGRLVVGKTKNLTLSVLNLPETNDDRQPMAGWHGVAVSTLAGRIRIFRPSGVRRPEAGGFGLFPRQVPEMDWPTALISGYKNVSDEVLPDRVYAMCSLPAINDDGAELPVVFGLGNNEVRWHLFRLRWRLRKQARQIGQRMLEEASSLEELLDFLQQVALFSVYWRDRTTDSRDFDADPKRDKHTLLELIPRLGRECRSDNEWRKLFLLVWDVLARRTPRYVAIGMIQALRRIQLKLLDRPAAGEDMLRRQAEIEEHITRIRKFVLDPGTFSKKKQSCFLELACSTDPSLYDERVVYRSILIARRHDPVFLTEFKPASTGLLGEVMTFTPLPTVDGGPFWEAEPEHIRFVAANYQGELWLLDGEGDGHCLIPVPAEDDKGTVRAAEVYGEDLLLSFSRGPVLRLALADVPPTVAEARRSSPSCREIVGLNSQPIDATAFATVPVGGDGGTPTLLWGDSHGRIHILGQPTPLVELGNGAGEISPKSLAILHMEWFMAEWALGQGVPLVLAALASGQLCLLQWHDNGSGPLLEPIASSSVCSGPITSMLVTGPERRHVVVASDGTAIGLQILGPSFEPRLGPVWAFSTGDSVRSIQTVAPDQAGDHRRTHFYRVLVGSHDAHIYALDLDGRHLETYSFRQDPLRHEQSSENGFKIGLFVAAPPRQPDDGPDVLMRVYACAFENRFCGLRLIDRPKMLGAFDRELDQLDAEQQEDRLSRWRAYHVEEGHLRHRFIRQSTRYPRQETAQVLEAIDWLLEAGNSSYEPTGEMTALLRRLFQDRRPAEDRAGVPQGMRAILADSRLYLASVHLLQQCGKRWDTPASIANRRVQLFWIRSFLREIEDKIMLRQWLTLGSVTADEDPMSHPESLLRHFLEDSHGLIQYKTLQYIERLLFGWPWVEKQRMFEPGEAREADLGWLLRSLFSRLRLRPEQVQQIDPSPVVLQIGRILCLLLRDRHVEPFYVSYLLQGYGLRQAMYLILADQWEAMKSEAATLETGQEVTTEPQRELRPDQIIRLAGRLDRGLEEGAPLTELITTLKQLMDRQWPTSRGPDKEYLEQTPQYFQALIPLLEVKDLYDLRELASEGTWQPPPAGRRFSYCPTYAKLAELRPLLDAIQNYYVQKYNDQWVDPVMTHLRFEDFDRVRREWRIWRSGVDRLLSDHSGDLAAREARLVRRLVEHWDTILLEAENVALLQDFQLTVEAHCFKEIEPISRFSSEGLQDLREEKLLALTAFTNLFTRLLLLAEPLEAVFLVRNEKDEAVLGYWFRDGCEASSDGGEAVAEGGERPGEVREISAETELPSWVSAEWFELDQFQELGARTIHDLATAIHKDRTWRVNTIAGSPGEPGYLGFYIFSWRNLEVTGFQRFEAQRLAWSVPLQALVYRRAAVEQEELKGRLFSIVAHNLGSPIYLMRSDLKVLADGRLEKFEEHRHDKYRQLLRQARHMDAIVDSILSLSDREISVELSEVAVARLVYEVVRTVRREAKPKSVQIDYPEPTEDQDRNSLLVTDETKVYDILLNLMVNAVKYSPLGGRVRVTTESSNKGIEVRIEDQGPGIPSSERPRVFEPFFRGAAAQRVAGLGLGLYSAKLYTDLLQGQIQIFNVPRGGSIFALFLPFLEENLA